MTKVSDCCGAEMFKEGERYKADITGTLVVGIVYRCSDCRNLCTPVSGEGGEDR